MKIELNFEKKHLYMFSFIIAAVAVIGLGIFAYAQSAVVSATHSMDEIEWDANDADFKGAVTGALGQDPLKLEGGRVQICEDGCPLTPSGYGDEGDLYVEGNAYFASPFQSRNQIVMGDMDNNKDILLMPYDNGDFSIRSNVADSQISIGYLPTQSIQLLSPVKINTNSGVEIQGSNVDDLNIYSASGTSLYIGSSSSPIGLQPGGILDLSQISSANSGLDILDTLKITTHNGVEIQGTDDSDLNIYSDPSRPLHLGSTDGYISITDGKLDIGIEVKICYPSEIISNGGVYDTCKCPGTKKILTGGVSCGPNGAQAVSWSQPNGDGSAWLAKCTDTHGDWYTAGAITIVCANLVYP